MDQIVKKARVNKRMVYHYFGSKDALFEAALVEVYQRIEGIEFEAMERGACPRAKLASLLESYFDFLDAQPEFTRLLQWENLEKGRHLTKANHLLTKNPFLEKFRETVQAGVATGTFRPDLDVPHLMIHFIGLCFIYHSNRFSLSQSLNLDLGDARVKAVGCRQVLGLVFDGIVRPPPEPIFEAAPTAYLSRPSSPRVAQKKAGPSALGRPETWSRRFRASRRWREDCAGKSG